MGFFSSIRNLFRADDAPETPQQTDAQSELSPDSQVEQQPEEQSKDAPEGEPVAADVSAIDLPPVDLPPAPPVPDDSALPEEALEPEYELKPAPVFEQETAAESKPAPVVEPLPEPEFIFEPESVRAPEPLPEPEAAPKPEPLPEPEVLPEQTTEPELQTPPTAATPVTTAPAASPAAVPVSAPVPAPAAERTPAQTMSAEETEMALKLREAEPRLSAWLAVVLDGVHEADDLLWSRIGFLLKSLEAPQEEIDSFIKTFRRWLDDMDYELLEDFRSELQYRLALALDLEDEEDERSRLMIKLSEGLAKTREHIARNLNTLFLSGRAIDESFWEELEEILIMGDVGFETAHGLTERLRKRAEVEGITDASELREGMRREMLEVFKPVRRISVVNPPEVALVIGVNGVGKTTTIAKLCHREVLRGRKVMLVAGDTFRAAATEQLGIWAERAGASFYAKGHGADPAAVAYEAMDKAMLDGDDLVFVDTAGRLHTKVNLMEELQKVSRVLGKRHPGAPHRTILVLDATTGQNALSQVKLFHEAVGIDELILTKLDGTAKGGIAVAVAMQYGIPISFIGLGEKMDDLRPFDAEGYVSALLGLDAWE